MKPYIVVIALLALTRASTADDPNSCVGRCSEGYNSANLCQCNEDCSRYGNCCNDYIGECALPDKCKGRCGGSFDSSLDCSCSDVCASYGDCCDDYIGECAAPDSCNLRCNEIRLPENSCHCDQDCVVNSDCCSDYFGQCTSDTSQYYCKGECGVDKVNCSCRDSCLDEKNCCPDYMTTCQESKPWHEEECAKEMSCPAGYGENTVILFSIDGFRAEYIHRNKTPNIWKLASCGVHAPYQRSVYPTKTFPNHYSIVTGLYPESHGIIDNTIYDHEHQEEFRLGAPSSFNSYWWQGEPLWITAKKQNKKSACFFWPGSDVNMTGGYPDYWRLYDGDVPFETRMYTALDWLDLPQEERPDFITLYIENVDHAGHSYGPVSSEVDDELVIADQTVGFLMEGLKVRGLESCVNLIVVADHGMAPISCNRKTSVEDYGVDADITYVRSGAMGRVGKSKDLTEQELFHPEELNEGLKCRHNETHWRSYLKYEYLPKRYHYANNDRIEDIHIVPDDEWLVEGRKGSYTSCNGGNHGYDNEFKSMHALFTAHGPAFLRGFNTSDGHENIELYNMMSEILGITPAPNNGTTGSMRHILNNPLSTDPVGEGAATKTCPYEEGSNDESLGCEACENESSKDSRLDLSSSKIEEYQQHHLLHGTPNKMQSQEYCLLTHQDYINAYDWTTKMTSYVAYTVKRKDRDLSSMTSSSCARADNRVSSSSVTSCSDYNNDENVVMMTLYPEELSSGDAKYDARVLTNFVPVYRHMVPVWKYLVEKLQYWSQVYDGVNVISGPVFDYNFDGHADGMEQIEKFLNNDRTSAPIPTHYFFVITRCKDKQIEDCREEIDQIQVLSFIIPNFSTMQCSQTDFESTDWVEESIREHVARVRDVELITDTWLMTQWSRDGMEEETKRKRVRVTLRLPQFDSDWFVKHEIEPNAAPKMAVNKIGIIFVALFVSLTGIAIY